MAYSSIYRGFGTSASPFAMSKANRNYTTRYAEFTHSSGDIRMYYDKVTFTGVGGGEVYRAMASAGVAGAAAGGTINAAHFTGQVASGKTVSGQLNAGRFTLEVAGTTPTPGGTLASLLVDTNIVTGWTEGTCDAFIRINNAGAGKVTNFLCVPVPAAKAAYLTDPFVAVHADSIPTHALAIVDTAGTKYWIMCTTDTPAD